MYQKNWGIYCDLLFLKAFIDLRSQLQGLLTLPHRKSAIWGRNIMKCNWHELIRTTRENDLCQISSLFCFNSNLHGQLGIHTWSWARSSPKSTDPDPNPRCSCGKNAPRCSCDLFPVATGRIWPLLRIPRPDGIFFGRKKTFRRGHFLVPKLLWNHAVSSKKLITYCWWTKSCTTKDDDNLIIYRVLTIPGGAKCLPSTVSKKNRLYTCKCCAFVPTLKDVLQNATPTRPGLWGQFRDLSLVDFFCFLYSDPQSK